MALKRIRDHAAEQRRRNELARERGYTGRGQQRGKIERGEIGALRPKQVRAPKTKRAQRLRDAIRKAAEQEKKDYRGRAPVRTPRQRAEDWSSVMAKTPDAQYNPSNAVGSPRRRAGLTLAAYTNAYLAAFVLGPEQYKVVRHNGGSDALRYWFVEVMETFEAAEYDERYKTF